MAKSDDSSLEARTYSVEEVGAIIRRATTATAAPPTAPLAGDDRVSWPDLVDIASDLDISETALRRAATPAPPAAPPRPAPRASDPPQAAPAPETAMAPADPLAAEKARFKRRVAHEALTLAAIGVVDFTFLTHGVIFAIAFLVRGVGLGHRAIRLWLGADDPEPVLTDGGRADWRDLRRAARHTRRAERYARRAERHARRAERYRL